LYWGMRGMEDNQRGGRVVVQKMETKGGRGGGRLWLVADRPLHSSSTSNFSTHRISDVR